MFSWSSLQRRVAHDGSGILAPDPHARALESAASAALLEQRGEPSGGDPSTIHALNRVDQAAQSALQAETIPSRSLDDLAAALADLPAEPQVADIVLSRGQITVLSCSDTFDLTATVLDPSGNPLAGVPIVFAVVDTSVPFLTMTPSSSVSGLDGQVETTVSMTASCESVCAGNNVCSTSIIASTVDGTVMSAPVPVLVAIP